MHLNKITKSIQNGIIFTQSILVIGFVFFLIRLFFFQFRLYLSNRKNIFYDFYDFIYLFSWNLEWKI
jgi:hypothetical protein